MNTYRIGDTVYHLPSFNSTDVLPSDGVPHGMVIQMKDTRDFYVFDEHTKCWIKIN